MTKSNMFYLSIFSSNLSDGILYVLFPLLAAQLTSVPTEIAFVAAAGSLPWLLFSLPAGVIIDRGNRNNIVFCSNIVRSCILVVLAYLFSSGECSLSILMLSAFLLGISEVFYDNTFSTFVPLMFKSSDLTIVNARANTIEWVANSSGGRLAGAFLLGAIGSPMTLAVGAGAYCFALVPFYKIAPKDQPRRKETRGTFLSEIATGFRYLIEIRYLKSLMISSALSNFIFFAMQTILILYVTKTFENGNEMFGLVQAAIGAGFAVASIFISRLFKLRSPRYWFFFASFLIPGCYFLYPLFHSAVSAIIASFLLGLSLVTWNAVSRSYRQSSVKNSELGKVNSIFRFVSWGASPIGSIFGGVMLHWSGYDSSFQILGVMAFLVAIYGKISLRNFSCEI